MASTNNKYISIIVTILFIGLFIGIPLEIFIGSNRPTGIKDYSVVEGNASEYEIISEYAYGEYDVVIGKDENGQINLYIMHDDSTVTISNVSYIKNVEIAGNNLYFIGSGEGRYIQVLDRNFKSVIDISNVPNNSIRDYFDLLINDDDTLTIIGDNLFTYDLRGNLIRTINLNSVIAYTNNYYLVINEGLISLNKISGETVSVLSGDELFKDKVLLFTKTGTKLEYKNDRLYLTIHNGKMCETYSFIDNKWLLSESVSC